MLGWIREVVGTRLLCVKAGSRIVFQPTRSTSRRLMISSKEDINGKVSQDGKALKKRKVEHQPN